jgi:hypothetical protein
LSLDTLLSRLQKVKGKGNSWVACCPAHEDKSPSLSVREGEDGRVLVHCFGGCSVDQIVGAVGMDMNDLFPPKREWSQQTTPVKAMKPRFYSSDLMRIISFEALVVMIAASDLSKGKKLNDRDMERMKLSCERIQEVARYCDV